MGRSYFTGPAFPSVDPISAALSTVAVSDGALIEGETMIATLTARRSSGVLLTEPSVVVVFTQGTGTSDGVFSETQDHGDGTYSATYLALTAGTARQIGATVAGVAVTSALPTVTVSAGVAYDTSGAIAPTNRLFAWDDFSSYASSAAFQAQCAYPGNDVGKKYWQVENKTYATIDTVVTLAGHQTLRVSLPGGTPATFQPSLVFRNTLNGGNGVVLGPGSWYDDLWVRIRWRFTNGFNLEGNSTPALSGRSFKGFGLGWLGGSGTGHGGRSTLEFDNHPNATLKAGLHATRLTNVFSCIGTLSGGNVCGVANDLSTGTIGTQYTDELWRDMIGHFGYTSALGYRLRWWRALTGQVPTRITNITGTVNIDSGHEADPVTHPTHYVGRPRIDRINPGLNYNMDRDDEISMHWGSLECSNGALWANPFDLPAAELV